MTKTELAAAKKWLTHSRNCRGHAPDPDGPPASRKNNAVACALEAFDLLETVWRELSDRDRPVLEVSWDTRDLLEELFE
jgi:hypothetical protein